MRSFVHLLIAIALVLGVAHVLRQTGMFVEAKHWADPHSVTAATSFDLMRYSGDSRPVILGNRWFMSKVRAACPKSDAAFIQIHQTFFDELAPVVEQLGSRSNAPVVMQIGNRTWFPNRLNSNVRLDYLPATDPFSIREIWISTGLMYQLVSDLLRPDPTRQRGPRNNYLLAAADLNGLSSLLETIQAQENDIYLVAADPKPIKGVTKRQISRRKNAIVEHGEDRLYKSVDAFVEDTTCAPLAKAASSQMKRPARKLN